VGSGFRKLNKTLQTLLGDGNQKAISDSLANIAKITQTFANNSPEIDASLKSTNRLLQQSIPGLVESIGRLTSTLPVLEQFIIELENNPSILIRGKAAQNLGPGE
jgi:ABC-type transporter Mla subunit MlaD